MTSSAEARILVVDDNADMTRMLSEKLTDAGYVVELAHGGEEAIAAVKGHVFDAVVSDLRMQGVDGLDVLDAIHGFDPNLPVLIMTAFGAIDSAIAAIRRGAYHYLTKPFPLQELLVYLQRAISDRRLRDEHRALQKLAVERTSLGAMVGRSKAMSALFELVERVAQSSAPVLVRGESGSGKELVARALHFQGTRRDKSFVAINCTALPEALLESELFGHARGAFTGAATARRGLFAEADGGTLFLDEIGDMPPGLQAKLLRVLEDGVVRAVGSDTTRKVDVRIIAASHQDLEARIRDGGFRADLYYRLKVVPIQVPSLRSRQEDIPLLAQHFFDAAKRRNPSAPVQRLSKEVLATLVQYPWPGNVRELENLMEQLVVVMDHPEIDLRDLEANAPNLLSDPTPIDRARQKLVPLRELESDYIEWVIARCNGNKTRAAEILGIDKSTLHRRERKG